MPLVRVVGAELNGEPLLEELGRTPSVIVAATR